MINALSENVLTDNVPILKSTVKKIFQKTKHFKLKYDLIENNFKKENLEVFKKTKLVAEKYANKAYNEIKDQTDKSLSLNKFLNAGFTELMHDTTAKNFAAIISTLSIIYINTFFLKFIISFGISLPVALMITAIFCSPFTEEYGKYLSVKHDYSGRFFFFFNTAEFLLSFKALVGAGVPIVSVILARLMTVLFHGFLTLIHVSSKENGEHEAKQTGGKTAVDEHMKTGLVVAIIIHALWNTIVSLRGGL